MASAVVIGVINQKGGVGKTTTVSHLGWYLAQQGLKVLMVDTDDSGNLTAGFGYALSKIPTLYDLLTKKLSFDKVLLKARPIRTDLHLHLVGSNAETAKLDDYAKKCRDADKTFVKEFILDDALSAYKYRYDVVLLDAPPTRNLMHEAVVAMADRILIPSQLATFSARGAAKLIDTIEEVCKLPGMHPPNLIGVLPVEFDGRQKESRLVAAEIIKNTLSGNSDMFLPPIPMTVDFKTAQASGVTVYEYKPQSIGIIGIELESKKGMNIHKLTGGYDHIGEIVHFVIKEHQYAKRS